MEALTTYLIKSSVWLTAFALVYVFFLRNERFFSLNRIYLVSGILVSIVFPFFTWHYTVLLPVVPSIDIIDPVVQGIVMPEESFPTQNLLLLLYFSGIGYLIFRILRQTLPVFRIIRKSETHQYRSAKLIRTDAYPASFSFFSFVFVNPSIDEIETNEIVNHEMEHIRQQHWIDLLLFEILRTVQWFNPAIWLYGHLIRQNHEYLADERALQRSSNPAVYRAALLNQMFGGPVISLANSFNYSLNKKRFNMMKKTISSPVRKLKLLMVLPLIAGVFYAFAAPEYQFVQTAQEEISAPQDTRTVKGKVTDENGKPMKSATVIIAGKTIGTITDNDGNFVLKVTDDSPIGISYVGFETIEIKPDFEKEMLITMKGATFSIKLDNQAPTTVNDKNNVTNLTGNFVKSELNETTSGLKFKANKLQGDYKNGITNIKADTISIDFSKTNELFILDGKEITIAEKENINPKEVESITVLKGETATKMYGEKGKYGAVLITLKKDNLDTQTLKIKANSPLKFRNADGLGSEPLYVVDKIITASKNIQNIDPELIESFSVLKDESATSLYGEDGKNGVVLITMKKGETSRKNEPIKVNVNNNLNVESKPLIVIDEVVSVNQNIDEIKHENMESMKVLKGEQATAKYGEKGKNGVIELKMKPKDLFVVVEGMPEFPGGTEALKTFVYSTMKYPPIALENGIIGQVTVKFVVDKTGSVTNAKIRWGVDPALDKEALRIVESMPKWSPGKQNGEAVDVAYEMPINFKLPADRPSMQKLEKTNNFEDKTFIVVEEQASFMGGDVSSFRHWVTKNIKYPPVAAKNGITGKVYVQFCVNSKGEVVDAKVVRGVDPSLDKEAVRVVMSSPLWEPAKQSGEKVKVQFAIPINFDLPANMPGRQTEEEFIVVEEQASFLGGNVNSFRDWVIKNIKYPPVAAKNGISGKVYVQYAVNSKGEVVDVKVVRGVDPSLDKEAVRVVMSSPLWEPAKQGETKVKQQFTIPIDFKLPSDKQGN